MRKITQLLCVCLCAVALVWACSSDNDDPVAGSGDNTGNTDTGSGGSGTDTSTDTDSGSSSGNSKDIDGWKCVWFDEFNTDGYLDETVWSKIHMDDVGYWAEWCKYSRTYDELYDVKDGNLILRGIYNKGDNAPYPADTCTYLTAGVRTMGKLDFFGEEGRLVVRAKLGTAKGCWPAFWMKPESNDIQDKKGEIDIMEHLNYDTFAYQTCHNYWTVVEGHNHNPEQQGTGTIALDDYNEYGVEVHSDHLYFDINGERTLDYPFILNQEPEDQFPYYKYPFFLMLDVQIDGEWVGAPDPNQGYPVEVLIDWVRYYHPSE